jgi:hypothetical protein
MAKERKGAGGRERGEIDHGFQQSRRSEALVASTYGNFGNFAPTSRKRPEPAGLIEPEREFLGRIEREIELCVV